MAPALTENAPAAPHTLSKGGAALDRSLFPDGLITSGHHNPDPSKLSTYEDFPKEITGPTVWEAEDYTNNPERWTHVFSTAEITELNDAADAFIAADKPLTGITSDIFPLATLGPFLRTVKTELQNGKGFILFKGLPVREWGLRKSATAYMGLGTHLGLPVSQNAHGHILGHVKDLGEDPSTPDRVRIYRTNAKQYFHTDGADLVGLLCMAKALSGGESDIVSTHHVWNTLQREHPDVARTMATGNWFFDRKGDRSQEQDEWYTGPLVYLEPETAKGGERRLWSRFDPMNLTSLGRLQEGPNARLPPLSPEQRHALKVFDDTCSRLALHMVLDPGDIQLLHNPQVFHARTAYTDHPAGAVDEQGRERPRRHLMRLWLATPESEGGWRTPWFDSDRKKRGGIQVDETPPKCPLDAE